MESSFRDFIEKNNLLNNCKSLLIGVSGGPDSLAMLNLFCELNNGFDIKIAAAHLDHMFREESSFEADFVEKFAQDKGIKFFRKRENLPELIKKQNISAEAAAREVRFNFFREIMNKYNYDLLALAHHRDDQAETVLLNLFRGSGLQGLSGIQPKVKLEELKVIHPMLCFSKEEILDYCKEKELNPRFDSSNKKNIYSRNIIRNKIFPVVESRINDKAREVIARSSNIIASENKFIEQLALKKYKEILIEENTLKVIIDFIKFKKIDQVLQRRIYRLIYNKINNNLDDLYFDHILEIEKLINNDQTGRGIDIASKIRVEISYSKLIFFKNEISNDKNKKIIEIKLDEEVEIDKKRSLSSAVIDKKDFSFVESSDCSAFDLNKLNLPLKIRSRKPGDKFVPLGMNGHKKVKDILIDEKVPKYLREKASLVVDAKDNIIWLAPYRISDDYKITEETDKVLILRLKYN
ncbi:MAG: tRNA lysidine(34) synthetase TilS [Bacillota bacterium]